MKKRDANKKTIALFSTLSFPIPAVCGGGVETLITNLIDVNEELNQVRFLVSSKYNKTACKKNYHNSDIYYFKNGILLSPVGLFLYIRWRYYRLRFKKSSQRNTTPMDFITYQYRYIAKREKVDVIVLENPYRLEKFAALKDIVSEENIYYHLHWTESGTGSGNIIDRQAIPNSISISEYVKNKWIKDNPQFGKNYVVYNCVDVERFSARVNNRDEEREKLGFTKQDFVVLFCGRFIPEKGVDKLLDAFEIIHSNKEERIKLLLIGSANYSSPKSTSFSDNVIFRAKQMDNVVYLGYIPNQIIHLYFGISDIISVPSVWEEGAGLVAIEGMAAGLPLIITQSGGMVEYVTDDCAVKLPINDELPETLAKAIIDLSKNPERKNEMGKAGRKRAKQFNKKNYYKDFLKIIYDKK